MKNMMDDPDDRAERAVSPLWCADVHPNAKWAIKILGRWRYTTHDIGVTHAGDLYFQQQIQDPETGTPVYTVLLELAHGEWQARVKLDVPRNT